MKKTTILRTLSVGLFTLLTGIAMAIPAKPGLWKTITLSDGTEVRARLAGDERLHYWVTEDGQRLARTADGYAPLTDELLTARARSRKPVGAEAASRGMKRVEMGQKTNYRGKKKGLVILVEFTDVKFQKTNDRQLYNHILNTPGYAEGKFRGSVTDYFKEQSGGWFELTFDVAGPYTLSHDMKYYGENDSDDMDMRPAEMVAEACRAANNEVNFANYDWDGDGEVDEVYVVYAGKGEADSSDSNTVWPHMWTLSAGKTYLKLDGVAIDTYACSNEVTPSNLLEGIGSFCHEFSHCLGLPDFYDINYDGLFGMGDLDLMSSGCYNGNGYCPANYTAHEKMMCGWQQPIVLGSNDVSVRNMKPVSDQGDTYIIYNEAYPNEYYMLENRQREGWDASYPAEGLMITYVDFDAAVWRDNIPNTIVSQQEATLMGYTTGNDHQRMTIFHADNNDDKNYWTGSYYSKVTTSTDLYPYRTNDSLTATSFPAATLYHTNLQGTKLMQGAILNIKQNDDGTINFDFRAKGGSLPQDNQQEGVLFYESFDKCNGTGGNDGKWSGSIASTIFKPDNEGWESSYERSADKCARFGTGSIVGLTTTPSFNIDGEATLTFKAAPWVGTSDGTDLQLFVNSTYGQTPVISPSDFKLIKGQWTECEATISGEGDVKVTFLPDQRFFLDEVKVVKKDPSAIRTIKSSEAPVRIFSIDGRPMGTDINALRHGLYIINGKKIIK